MFMILLLWNSWIPNLICINSAIHFDCWLFIPLNKVLKTITQYNAKVLEYAYIIPIKYLVILLDCFICFHYIFITIFHLIWTYNNLPHMFYASSWQHAKYFHTLEHWKIWRTISIKGREYLVTWVWAKTRTTEAYFFIFSNWTWISFFPSSVSYFFEYFVNAFFLDLYQFL